MGHDNAANKDNSVSSLQIIAGYFLKNMKVIGNSSVPHLRDKES